MPVLWRAPGETGAMAGQNEIAVRVITEGSGAGLKRENSFERCRRLCFRFNGTRKPEQFPRKEIEAKLELIIHICKTESGGISIPAGDYEPDRAEGTLDVADFPGTGNREVPNLSYRLLIRGSGEGNPPTWKARAVTD